MDAVVWWPVPRSEYNARVLQQLNHRSLLCSVCQCPKFEEFHNTWYKTRVSIEIHTQIIPLAWHQFNSLFWSETIHRWFPITYPDLKTSSDDHRISKVFFYSLGLRSPLRSWLKTKILRSVVNPNSSAQKLFLGQK